MSLRTASLGLLTASLLAACGAGEPTAQPPAAGPPPVAEGDLPRPLAGLRAQQGRLLPGGPDAFRARLRELRGHPVVVNKWATWCPPCRSELTFFRSQAARRAQDVAFLGVNSQDERAAAEAFNRRLRPGFPSYEDPDLEVAAVFKGVASFPTTAFYDSKGELAYVKQGAYATEAKLVEDIERHAR